MKIVYDAEIDALSIAFQDTTVTSRHLEEGITADHDADGNLAGSRSSTRASGWVTKTRSGRL